MKASQLGRCAVFAATVAGCSISGSDEPNSTLCSDDQDFIAFVSTDLENNRQALPRRTTASGKTCVEWSNKSPLPSNWFNEITERYHTGRVPPVGAVTGTGEDNANLKKALGEAAIPFSTKMQGKGEWIYWDESDNEKARAVVKRVWGSDLTPSTAADEAALAEARRSWAVDEKRASKIVLDSYPNILTNAYMMGPSVATFSSRPPPGFEDAGRYAWIVLIICNGGQMHARFFVHPANGKLSPSVKPGDKNSAECT
jgi:hypothetical protein